MKKYLLVILLVFVTLSFISQLIGQQNKLRSQVLVSTDWVASHLNDENVVIVEIDADASVYTKSHIPGAISWNWQTELSDNIRRDIVSRADMERLLEDSGISSSTKIVLYGDKNNWFAAWAFWQLKIYGHKDVRMMDGGRKKWLAENRPLSNAVPLPTKSNYSITQTDNSLRALLPEVQALVKNGGELVDVRSRDEFTGKILAPPGLPETCQRGGHIPGAKNISWGLALNEDGTFKSYEELKDVYNSRGITGENTVIAYCRIGERSSFTWFVLKYLLGLSDVKNYDGSWTEWGNLVGAEIETGL